MSFDLDGLRAAVARHGTVSRVLVAEVRGSSPREVGAAMLVWPEGDGYGLSGTIGGGTLEHQAAQAALRGETGISRHALGPDLGQCCGGAVVLLTESYDAAAVAALDGTAVARPVAGGGEMPLSVARIVARLRGVGALPAPQLIDGWMVEPVQRPARPVWIWGAGHVGRAIVAVLHPLPDLGMTWVDTDRARFPATIPDGVTAMPAARPEMLVRHAPPDAAHLVLTYSHALDLELCHRLLDHGFGFAGLIGSATKWARFRSRLTGLGHAPERIAAITCPIGDPMLGKHPQAIAIGVAAALLQPLAAATDKEKRA